MGEPVRNGIDRNKERAILKPRDTSGFPNGAGA